MGRIKLFGARIVLPLKQETLAQIDELTAKDETRLDLIREAIERELKRREAAGRKR